MGGTNFTGRGRRRWAAAWALTALATLASLAMPGLSRAQDKEGAVVPARMPRGEAKPDAQDPEIIQTGCASCGNGLLGALSAGGGCAGCGAGGCFECYPGREPCDCCLDQTGPLGRLFGGLYECICCPDPCYEGKWNVLADAAFFADAPRPITQMRLRYHGAFDYKNPDKAEFLLPRTDGRGSYQVNARDGGRPRGAFQLDQCDYRMYNEGAVDRFSFFIDLGYRHIDPDILPTAAGFTDIELGTKSLLLDCELTQIAFQFKTYIPSGNPAKGLGTGHVSLEPSLLMALKLTPRTYLQGQFAFWGPIGGSPDYQGPVIHYHASLNQILWNCGCDLQLVGTLEAGAYHFLSGRYTIPNTDVFGLARDVGDVFNVGPGLRLNVCDKIDFGVGSQFAITDDSVGDFIIRAEFRWRF